MTTRWEALRRWVADPRTGMAVAVSLLAAAVIATVLISGITAQRALGSRDQTGAAASRRVDLLNERIEELGDRLVEENRENGIRIGELSDQVAALQEQVRQLGGIPVVVVSTTTTTTGPAPATTTSMTQPPPTTTTTQPPPEEPPPDDGGICLGPICIGA